MSDGMLDAGMVDWSPPSLIAAIIQVGVHLVFFPLYISFVHSLSPRMGGQDIIFLWYVQNRPTKGKETEAKRNEVFEET